MARLAIPAEITKRVRIIGLTVVAAMVKIPDLWDGLKFSASTKSFYPYHSSED